MKSDVQLQRDVLDELNWDPSLDAAQLGVTVKEGVVTLRGHLPVLSQKHTAEEVVKRVHGVLAIANEIEIRPPEASVRDDEEIAAAVVHALAWDARLAGAKTQVMVDHGWITVEGTVEHVYQRGEVERVIRHLAGVRGLTNAVVVTSPQIQSALVSDINGAMRRSAALHSRELSVELDGPTVILTGDVHSYSELEEAARIASAAPGVRQVKNCLTVTPWGTGPAQEWGY